MIGFYDVNPEYVEFLREYDTKVPNVLYSTGNNKFVCGIVLYINGIEYYAPISHSVKPQRTNIIIYDNKHNALSSIKFAFMFPATQDVVVRKNFKEIATVDRNYANLLNKEFNFCCVNENVILQKAKQVYKIGCNQNHPFNSMCCNFKMLEEHYLEFKHCK